MGAQSPGMPRAVIASTRRAVRLDPGPHPGQLDLPPGAQLGIAEDGRHDVAAMRRRVRVVAADANRTCDCAAAAWATDPATSTRAPAALVQGKALRVRRRDEELETGTQEPVHPVGVLAEPVPESLVREVDERKEPPVFNEIADLPPQPRRGIDAGRVVTRAVEQHDIAGRRLAERREQGVALLADTVGFLTILVINIQSIRELAIAASLGVGVVIITNLFLLPIILSSLRLPPAYGEWVTARRARTDRIWARISAEMKPGPSLIVIAVWLGLGAWGYYQSQKIKIGDLFAGVPELRQDSRYNRDTSIITSKFSIGVDILSVLVESAPNGCVDYDVVNLMDQFDVGSVAVESSKRDTSTRARFPSLARARAAMPGAGSRAVTIRPRSTSGVVAIPIPASISTACAPCDSSPISTMSSKSGSGYRVGTCRS